MTRTHVLALIAALTVPAFFAQASPPETVRHVDLRQYLGGWYEIARMPNSFQDNQPRGLSECFNTRAEYGELKAGKISVTNTCLRLDASGREQTEIARAVGRVVDTETNAKLKVNFTGNPILRWLGIGDGDYWILALGPLGPDGYEWALVGGPDRKFGWILARQTELPESTLRLVKQAIVDKGYVWDSFRFARRLAK